MKPSDIRIVDEGREVMITWPDESRDLYAVPYLQLSCRCAQCVDEMTGERRIQSKDVNDQARVLEFSPVGNYAVRFRWTSGCQTGIYSYDYLHEIRPGNRPQV